MASQKRIKHYEEEMAHVESEYSTKVAQLEMEVGDASTCTRLACGDDAKLIADRLSAFV